MTFLRSRRFWTSSPLLLLLCAVGVAGWFYYRAQQPDGLVARGQKAIQRGDWEAVESLSVRLEAKGQRDRANLLRGEAFVAREQWPDALSVLNKILDEGDLRVQAALLAGRSLLELKELREAHRVFSFVITKDPDNVVAHRGLAAIAYDLGNLTAALYHLDKVCEIDDEDGRSYRLKGLIRSYLSQDAEAELAYREALKRKLPPEFRRQAMLELAERLVKRTRYNEALEILDERKGDEADEDLPALAVRGECLLNLARLDEAEKLLDLALADFPKNATLWSLRGQIHLGQKKTIKAIESLEKAVKLSPGDYQFRFQLAKAYNQAGRADEAAVQQKRSDELSGIVEQLSTMSRDAMRRPWDAEIRLKLAELCEKIDSPKLAAMWYEAARACKKSEAEP